MARVRGAHAIYELADQFRQRCLTTGHSLLWPADQAWTVDNLARLRQALEERVEIEGGFYDALRHQIDDCSISVHKIAVDVVAFYQLPIAVPTKPATKMARIKQMIEWKLGEDRPDLTLLNKAFTEEWDHGNRQAPGLMHPGQFYLQQMPWQIAFFVDFARNVLSRRADIPSVDVAKRIASEVQHQQIWGSSRNCSTARHILMHLLFPDRFERMASDAHKQQIVEIFKSRAGGASDVDEALFNIRQALERKHTGEWVDFYGHPEISRKWGWSPGEVEGPASQPRVWIEKTLVRGRPDREEGKYALGRALWSPKRSKSGGDIYRFMRGVQPGDVVLHLTDNEGFTGISHAAGAVEDFEGLPGTQWGEQDSYLVRLEDFESLDPPLRRQVFFASPLRERLVALIEAGTKHLFYNAEPSLNQGAYLTPAPPELVAILSDAYHQVAGRPLVPTAAKAARQPSAHGAGESPAGLPPIDALAEATNLTSREIVDIVDLLRRKKQLIIEGPPGAGKTFVAEKFARYFTGNTLDGAYDERMVIIQFHQSYGYEDFIQGIRPETNEDGQLEYHVQDGIFKRLCAVAERNRDKDFVILIDEINRGNISRILGEVLLLFEYRDMSVPLPYSKANDPRFSIPPNVHLIGTMNTTDRSLAQIDYALRRRFYFYRMMPVVDGEAPVLARWLTKMGVAKEAKSRVLQLFINLNERVQRELGEHYQVGHSYFMDPEIGSEAGVQRIWNRAIMPLLEEYFYNRRDRVEVLAEFTPERLFIEGAGTEAEADTEEGV